MRQDDLTSINVLRTLIEVKSLSAYTRVGGEFFILYSKSYTDLKIVVLTRAVLRARSSLKAHRDGVSMEVFSKVRLAVLD